MKALAVLLDALGNVSQGMIAKLLGVSHVAVYKWVRAAGEDAPTPSATPSSGIVQIDEMWHFVDGKKTRFGSGRAFDPVARRTLAWELGGRDDADLPATARQGRRRGQCLSDRRLGRGFHRLIPAEQLFTGKDLTFPIEQDHSDVRHHLARFRRRSKVTSRARHMVDGALRLLCRLRRPENFLPMRDSFLSISG